MSVDRIASRSRRGWLAWPLALLALQRARAQTAAPRLSLTTGALPPLTAADGRLGFIEEIARAAFGRVGVEVEVNTVPTERSLINVNAGRDDGDIFRVAGVEKEYPNVVRIPEKTLDNEFIAYTTTERTDIKLAGWDDLRPYSVAFATGWKPFERNVVGVRELTKNPSMTCSRCCSGAAPTSF
jgi:polar amino acid transport system substrate-binding protein